MHYFGRWLVVIRGSYQFDRLIQCENVQTGFFRIGRCIFKRYVPNRWFILARIVGSI